MALNAPVNPDGTDLTTREFVCQVEGCNKAFVGLFKFATHEKYFHKLPASERVSRSFMHICPFPPCVMEYVERDALDNHVQERHKAPNPDVNSRVTSTQPPMVSGAAPSKLADHLVTPGVSQEGLNSTPFTQQPPTKVSAENRGANSANVVKISENLADAPSRPGTSISKPKRSFACPILGCAQKFNTHPQLKKHEAEGHQRKKSVHVCPHSQCPHSFRTEPKLKKHIRESHKNGVQFHVVPTVAPLQPPFKPAVPDAGRSVKGPDIKATIRSPAVVNNIPVSPVVSPQLFTCQYQGCGQQFPSLKKFGRHQRKHGLVSEQTTSTALPLSCPVTYCVQKFAAESFRQQHITREHIGTLGSSANPIPPPPTGPASVRTPLAAPKPTSWGPLMKPVMQTPMPSLSSSIISTQSTPTQPKNPPNAGNIVNNQGPTSNSWQPYFMSANPYPGPIVPMHNPFMRFHAGNTTPSNNLNPPSINPIGTPAFSYINTPAPQLHETSQTKERGNMSVPAPATSKPIANALQLKTSSHTGQRQLPCSAPNCFVTFTEALDLRMHEKIVHKRKSSDQTAKQYKLQCSDCTKSYWTQQHLDAHILNKHSAPLPSVTPSNPPALPTLNPTNETSIKPAATGGGQRTYNHMAPSSQGYSCSVCLVVFPTGAELNSHIRNSPLHRWFLEKRVGTMGTGGTSL